MCLPLSLNKNKERKGKKRNNETKSQSPKNTIRFKIRFPGFQFCPLSITSSCLVANENRERGQDLEMFYLNHSESGQSLESYRVDKLQQYKNKETLMGV